MKPASNSDMTSASTSRIRAWLGTLGPGIITAALVFGPSKITITSKLGADYGFSLLWIVAVAIFFMAIFTAMAGRIGRATDKSFLSTIREKWGQPVTLATGLGVFLVTASFQTGNSVGIGIAAAELSHTPATPWIVFFNLLAISLLFFRSFYKTLERMMIFLVMVILFAFLVTLFLSKPSLTQVASGIIPSVPAGSSGLVIAFVASCFSIVGACYQSYLVQEQMRINPNVKQTSSDSLPGILILGAMAAIVLICAAAVLNPQGIHVNSGSDMAKALEPLFGNYASTLFLCGLFAASFSALIGNASLGGTLLGDALGYGGRFNSKAIRWLIAVIMIIGATLAIIFGKLPIQLMIFAQSITIVIVPFIGITLYVIANDSRLMGNLVNTLRVKILAGLGLLLLIVLAIQSISSML